MVEVVGIEVCAIIERKGDFSLQPAFVLRVYIGVDGLRGRGPNDRPRSLLFYAGGVARFRKFDRIGLAP